MKSSLQNTVISKYMIMKEVQGLHMNKILSVSSKLLIKHNAILIKSKKQQYHQTCPDFNFPDPV